MGGRGHNPRLAVAVGRLINTPQFPERYAEEHYLALVGDQRGKLLAGPKSFGFEFRAAHPDRYVAAPLSMLEMATTGRPAKAPARHAGLPRTERFERAPAGFRHPVVVARGGSCEIDQSAVIGNCGERRLFGDREAFRRFSKFSSEKGSAQTPDLRRDGLNRT